MSVCIISIIIVIRVFSRTRLSNEKILLNPGDSLLVNPEKVKMRDRHRSRFAGKIQSAAFHHLYIFLCFGFFSRYRAR